MTYKSLTQEELTALMAHTSPHSFPHNVECLHAFMGLPVLTEPAVSENTAAACIVLLRHFLDSIKEWVDTMDSQVHEVEEALNGTDVDVKEDTLTDLAVNIGSLSIMCRSMAMSLGIPMEDVQEALVASVLTGRDDPIPAVKTIMFGVV